MSYDPWQKCKTYSGLAADLVISALQKEIRRNHEENACTLAYEMLITSPAMEEYLWYRLHTISVEDVGFGDVMAPVVIQSLDEARKAITPGWGDRNMIAIHAVRFLCKCRKDRSSDELYNWISKSYQKGTLRPELPDYCYDKHTLQGQQMGRNDHDFYYEGSKVSPEWEERDKTYRERLLKMLEEDGGEYIK